MSFPSVLPSVSPHRVSHCHSPVCTSPSADSHGYVDECYVELMKLSWFQRCFFPRTGVFFFSLTLIVPLIVRKTQCLQQQSGQTESSRWSCGKGWECLNWFCCWRKHTLHLVISLTYTRIFLEICFDTYLPLSVPKKLFKNLVFSFSAHSSVSSGTWLKCCCCWDKWIITADRLMLTKQKCFRNTNSAFYLDAETMVSQMYL